VKPESSVQELDGRLAKAFSTESQLVTHKLRSEGIDKRRSVTIKDSYFEGLLGESKSV
jgi:hypothetical protein